MAPISPYGFYILPHLTPLKFYKMVLFPFMTMKIEA